MHSLNDEYIPVIVTANIEININEIISNIAEKKNINKSDVTINDIQDFVSNNVTHIKGKDTARYIRQSYDAPINHFTTSTVCKLQDIIRKRKEKDADEQGI